ncbi:hypothetical protein WDZ92_20495 [Nostoc sp. NIES-2111]
MKYEEPREYSRSEALEMVAGDSVENACRAIIGVALREPDGEWAEWFCMKSLGDDRRELVGAAIVGLGHVARIHRKLSPSALQQLAELRTDSDYSGRVEDVLEDFAMFGEFKRDDGK